MIEIHYIAKILSKGKSPVRRTNRKKEQHLSPPRGVNLIRNTGADPGFQARGGALKNIAPSGGRRDNCWDISCEKSRFYAKKSYFFQF